MDRPEGFGSGDARGVLEGLHQPLLPERAEAGGPGDEEGGQQRAGTDSHGAAPAPAQLQEQLRRVLRQDGGSGADEELHPGWIDETVRYVRRRGLRKIVHAQHDRKASGLRMVGSRQTASLYSVLRNHAQLHLPGPASEVNLSADLLHLQPPLPGYP